jgi:glycerophosphoryl diester phosphodiesterase
MRQERLVDSSRWNNLTISWETMIGRALIGLLLVASAMAESRVLVHGHRGARSLRPENTLPAFEYAIQVGADVIELDVVVTKDNVPVVWHDPVLPSALCKGPQAKPVVRELTLAELREYDCGWLKNPAFPRQVTVPGTRISTLDEVFALAGKSRVEFNVEIKMFRDRPELTPLPEEFARLVLDAVRKHKLEQRVIVQSFDFRPLKAMKELAPGIRLAALFNGRKEDFAAIAAEAGVRIVAPHYSLVTPDKVKAAHAAGLQVIPWTANEPDDWKRLVACGVDAIITDDPEGLIAFLRKAEL